MMLSKYILLLTISDWKTRQEFIPLDGDTLEEAMVSAELCIERLDIFLAQLRSAVIIEPSIQKILVVDAFVKKIGV